MINEVNHDTGGKEEPRKSRAVSTKIKEEATTGDVRKLDISVPRKAKLQTKTPAAKMKREVFEDQEDISEVEGSNMAMLSGKSRSNGKRSAQKVKPEVVDKEGIEDDIPESRGKVPYKTVETSNATVRAADSQIEFHQLIWGSGSQAERFDQSYSFQN